MDVGIPEAGTGQLMIFGFSEESADKLYYRVKAITDPYNSSFLSAPTNFQEAMFVDGVRFGFNLNALSTLPAKVRLYARPYDPEAEWDLIGVLTDFTAAYGQKFLKGSIVWLPTSPDDYETQAVALDNAGNLIGSAIRRVIVNPDQAFSVSAPVIGSSNYNGSSEIALPSFNINLIDRNLSDVRFIEYSVSDKVVGENWTSPFGENDQILNLFGFGGMSISNGIHNIKAKAFDYRGLSATSSGTAITVNFNSGDAKPVLSDISLSKSVVTRGETFTVNYSAINPDTHDSITEVAVWHIWKINGYNQKVAFDNSAPFGAISVNTAGWEPGTHHFYLVATDTGPPLALDSFPAYFSVYVRATAQEVFANDLVTDFAEPNSVSFANPKFTGIKASSAKFTGGTASGLQFDQGVLLTTGLASLWNTGNLVPYSDEYRVSSFPNKVEFGDRDLDMRRFDKKNSNDAACLEFDCTPVYRQLEFEYQFGSEDYLDSGAPSYLCDTFLISITRPAGNAATPATCLPDGLGVVGVNSVNINQNRHLYLDSYIDIRPNVAEENWANLVEYNGMTVNLRSHILLSPGHPYRMKFVIADTGGSGGNGDFIDSGLFLRKSSLRSVNPVP